MQSSTPVFNKNRFINRPLRGRCVYFIGIGGIGMSAVARLLLNEGCVVSGSDIQSSSLITSLEEMGARIDTKQNGSFMAPETDFVVVSAAISEDNPELRIARKMGLKVVKYSEMLGSLMQGKQGIAISGTHGKTTTSAMISTILKRADLDPTFVIGGEVPDIGGNAHLGKGDLFIAEACEYGSSFLDLVSRIGVITNIEEDHLDYYENIETIVEAFGCFASLISRDGLLVVNNHDHNITTAVKQAKCKVETFSLNKISDWCGEMLPAVNGLNRFKVFHKGAFFGEFALNIPGAYNILNALAATAVCTYIGVSRDNIKNALSSFRGAKRRFQIVYAYNGITIVDDYAHHPTEISATLKAARELYAGKELWCVFQPHQYSRTRHLLKGFTTSFQYADKVILSDIYSARDNNFEKALINSKVLYDEIYETGIDVQYVPQLSDIKNILYNMIKSNAVVITMGAGDVWQVAYDFAEMLR